MAPNLGPVLRLSESGISAAMRNFGRLESEVGMRLEALAGSRAGVAKTEARGATQLAPIENTVNAERIAARRAFTRADAGKALTYGGIGIAGLAVATGVGAPAIIDANNRGAQELYVLKTLGSSSDGANKLIEYRERQAEAAQKAKGDDPLDHLKKGASQVAEVLPVVALGLGIVLLLPYLKKGA